jgi:hypothetical protein
MVALVVVSQRPIAEGDGLVPPPRWSWTPPNAMALSVDLASYLTRRMTAPDGGFFTAEDADIEGKEGESYLWTRAEITDGRDKNGKRGARHPIT